MKHHLRSRQRKCRVLAISCVFSAFVLCLSTSTRAQSPSGFPTGQAVEVPDSLLTVTDALYPAPGIRCVAPPTLPPGGTAVVQTIGTSTDGGPVSEFFLASAGTLVINGATTAAGHYTGAGGTATFIASNLQPGQFAWIFCHVQDDHNQIVSSYATINIVSAPPTVACSGPASITQNQAATITASGTSTSGGALTYSFTSSAGSLSVNGKTASLDSSGLPPHPITVTCTATDVNQQSASASTTIFIDSATGEQALPAFSFPDSVGININLHETNTPYAYSFPAVMQLMQDLGIHHYRNPIDPYSGNFEYANAESLARVGIKADWVIGDQATPSTIQTIYALAPDSVEEFEGPNETTDIAPHLTNVMATIHDTVRSIPALANVPIYAPTIVYLSQIPQMGDLSPYVTAGNMHDYYNPRYPETPAYGGTFYGCGAYGTLSFNDCLAQIPAPNLPVVSTETGFVSGVVPDAAIGRYLPRLLFMHLGHKVKRTYLYELADEANSLKYGLVDGLLVPKPSFYAIKNLIGLFLDSSTFNTPAKVEIGIGGNTANVQHVVFQRSDGTFMVAIWLGVESAYWPSTDYTVEQTLLNPAPQTVSITTNTQTGNATIYTLDDNGNLSAAPGVTSNFTTLVPVSDRVTVVSLPRR